MRGPGTHPLLSITVLQVIIGAVIPVESDAHKERGQEAVLGQNHKVGKETTQSLDHTYTQTHISFSTETQLSGFINKVYYSQDFQLTNLSVSDAYKTLIHKFVSQRVPWLPFHDVTLSSLVGQGDGGDLRR